MWRHPSETFGHYSGAGPSPSQIGGILGAAMGCRMGPTVKGARPVSADLLSWLKDFDVTVACRLLSPLDRLDTSFNGFKEISGFQTFRAHRQSLDRPEYEILVALNDSGEANRLVRALSAPYYNIYLGDSNHPGLILDAELSNASADGNWAYNSDSLEGEYVWNMRFGSDCRIKRKGYLVYPELDKKHSVSWLACIAD